MPITLEIKTLKQMEAKLRDRSNGQALREDAFSKIAKWKDEIGLIKTQEVQQLLEKLVKEFRMEFILPSGS